MSINLQMVLSGKCGVYINGTMHFRAVTGCLACDLSKKGSTSTMFTKQQSVFIQV